jgi:hypothetical protein
MCSQNTNNRPNTFDDFRFTFDSASIFNHLDCFIASGCENLRTLKINKNEMNHKFIHELKQVLERENSSFEENPIYSALNPYEEENFSSSNTYVNHCFKCSAVIDSRKNEQCVIYSKLVCAVSLS